ncbi:hypothetical protein BaRGS_00026014, partial [Batillaria attramentaria]
ISKVGVSFSSLLGEEDKWQAESRRLGDLVQRRLDYLQNPANCDDAKLLVCDLAQQSGFGSQLHHLLYCQIVAYATRRTMVIKKIRIRYGNDSWEDMIQPPSRTCTDFTDKAVFWGAGDNWESRRVVYLPTVNYMKPRREYLPLAFPKDLAPSLSAFHGDPAVWWLGQVLRYAFQPKEKIRVYMDAMKQQLGFEKPIVGIQVRRTDKISSGEGSFHSLEEYMGHVNNYFRKQGRHKTLNKWRVFLATEDPTVLNEARQNNYNGTVLSKGRYRYTNASMLAVVLDIHLLSLTDFLVCTFSSNLCRAAYELMQTYHVDASDKARSLDVRFYFHGQTVKAIESYTSNNKSEVQFEAGDLLRVQGLLNRARNLRTNSYGYYDVNKAVDERKPVPMPTYPEAEDEDWK